MNQDTQTQSLKVISADDTNPLLPAPPAPLQAVRLTAEQAKADGLAQLVANAYANAGKLKLTPEEMKLLKSDFTDDAFQRGANGNLDLLYIEHAFLRDRLDEIFGSEWAVIPRYWAEDFEYEHIDSRDKTKSMRPASRVYCEAIIMARGCLMACAIGDMIYYKSNATQNYSDAVEGAKTAAIRRCCKERGIGLQAFKKDFVEGWKQRHPQGRGATPRQQAPPATTQAPQGETAAPAPVQSGGVDWRNVKVPFGKNEGALLGDLTGKSLGWYVDNFKIKTQYENNGVMVQCAAKNVEQQRLFRLALDACAKELGIDKV